MNIKKLKELRIILNDVSDFDYDQNSCKKCAAGHLYGGLWNDHLIKEDLNISKDDSKYIFGDINTILHISKVLNRPSYLYDNSQRIAAIKRIDYLLNQHKDGNR